MNVRLKIVSSSWKPYHFPKSIDIDSKWSNASTLVSFEPNAKATRNVYEKKSSMIAHEDSSERLLLLFSRYNSVNKPNGKRT